MDAEAYRRESRTNWDTAAAGWHAQAERLGRATMPVSEWLVDALAPQPGHQMLELAAGTGEVGLLLAELVHPGGEVIVSDFAPGMLTAAQQRAEGRRLANVRFKQIDAESIDLAAASQDGVACRWGLMLMADPAAALREIRRVLRPGRPLALAAWSGREDNPWRALFADALGTPAVTEGPGMFAWERRETIAAHLEDAGFSEHRVEAVDFPMSYSGVDDWIDSTAEMSVQLRETLADAREAGRERLREALQRAAEPFTAPGGEIVLPARSWVAWAVA